MDFYDWNHGFLELGSIGNDEFLMNSNGFRENCGNVDGLMKSCGYSEKGEIMKSKSNLVAKKSEIMSDDKSSAALKSHSEAEKRRRERINAHLDTLRGLVPCNDKMDKATLLAEVIRQVKQLKINAKQASIGLLMPEDIEEVKIEKVDQAAVNGYSTFHVSVCSKHRPELLTDIKRALTDLKVKIDRAELSTLGDSVKFNFDFITNEDLISSVREALTSIIEKGSMSFEYSPRTMFPNKRRRYCL
ncbi:transcription factor bHLH106-like [Rutidosis leptorrhynchoides]|uniref:transcription factor bHLH106-like n=1 Tax=Rutidosis leptorrhynchoides TaxID=125765 RepID=UPI003A99237D